MENANVTFHFGETEGIRAVRQKVELALEEINKKPKPSNYKALEEVSDIQNIVNDALKQLEKLGIGREKGKKYAFIARALDRAQDLEKSAKEEATRIIKNIHTDVQETVLQKNPLLQRGSPEEVRATIYLLKGAVGAYLLKGAVGELLRKHPESRSQIQVAAATMANDLSREANINETYEPNDFKPSEVSQDEVSREMNTIWQSHKSTENVSRTQTASNPQLRDQQEKRTWEELAKWREHLKETPQPEGDKQGAKRVDRPSAEDLGSMEAEQADPLEEFGESDSELSPLDKAVREALMEQDKRRNEQRDNK